jgi:hypothetical protein
VALLARRRVLHPIGRLGLRFTFADGTAAAVYRETVIERPPTAEPAVLIVGFRLRLLHGDRAHAAFRVESWLNTVLFAGFPGLVSKLWCRHDEGELYRGVYEWDGPALAHEYVQALSWVLNLVSVPGSVHYVVLPGLRCADLLADPSLAAAVEPGAGEWWRVVEAEVAVP